MQTAVPGVSKQGKEMQNAVTSLTVVCFSISLDFVVIAILTISFLGNWVKLKQETLLQDRT